MPSHEKSDLFQFMLKRVKETQQGRPEAEPQAFGRWFINLYFLHPQGIFVSDGSKDGKIDLFFTTHNGKSVLHHVLNTKYTREFDKIAPPAFYQEIKYFWHAFENRDARQDYLAKAVKPELRPRYKLLFDRYDAGAAQLMFVTNHRRNEAHYLQVKNLPVQVFHLDDLIQCLVDDIDGAMPRTPPIRLEGIHAVLSPDKADTEIATSIVFARLIDFLRYMEEDPFDMLFNRNVRVAIGVARSSVNQAIRETFETNPKEFAFSNNGITMLCERQHYDPGQKVLTLENPRVVNGSQTLHSIRDVADPSDRARVMVRVIEIDPPVGDDIEQKIRRRKEVIDKIAVRSNRQNPIKSWDLASNDDFQLGLFRLFRSKGLFYERRPREWQQRSRELKSVNVQLGTDIRSLTQLIASYHAANAKLGPASAKKVADLFEGAAYEKIRETKPELAYQLYLISNNIAECQKSLAAEKAYVRKLKSFARFAIFALATRALKAEGAKLGDPAFTTHLADQQVAFYPTRLNAWKSLTKACIDHTMKAFKTAEADAKVKGVELTYPNYFKSQGQMSQVVSKQPSEEIGRAARKVLQH